MQVPINGRDDVFYNEGIDASNFGFSIAKLVFISKPHSHCTGYPFVRRLHNLHTTRKYPLNNSILRWM
jgi:hypothetical protein